MATVRAAAGGGRWVDVDPVRLPRWLNGFTGRHGPSTVETMGDGLVVRAADGSRAELYPPPGAPPATGAGLDDLVERFITTAQAPRRLGLLLARQASVAVGLADGTELVESKVDSYYVQGRTAAGGWSQQRYARRRVNQAKAAAGDAAEVVLRVLGPHLGSVVAVVTGGDRRAVEAILADPRLAPVVALRSDRFLDVPEPRRAVLEQAIGAARAVRIKVVDPPSS